MSFVIFQSINQAGSVSRTSELLGDLVSDGILAAQGSNRWRTYTIADERAARRYLEESD